MNQETRGGNSRLLAKSLDQLEQPIAVLDRRGIILFVNAALCRMVDAAATSLVGQFCSWQIADDDAPLAAILTALAPPAGALQGKVTARQLTTPIVFGSTATGQLFLPILDHDRLVHQTLVVLGKWEDIETQLPLNAAVTDLHRRRQTERTLVSIRSHWKAINQLTSLIGESPAIELAMTRAQLAVASDCHFLVTGPQGLHKTEIAQGILLGRLRRAGIKRLAAQFLPLDCAVLDDNLFAGMLEVFAGRLRDNSPKLAQQLHLSHIDSLTAVGVQQLLEWFGQYAGRCTLSATSLFEMEQLVARGGAWPRLIAKLAELHVHLPPLSQRAEDIAPLAQQALASFCTRTDRAQLVYSPAALDVLALFPWPGNLTQLTEVVQDAVKHAVLSASVQVNHLPVAVRTYASTAVQASSVQVEPIDLDEVLLEVEKVLLQRALRLSPRNRAQAARWLGISRPRLLRRISQLGLGDGQADQAEDA